MKRLLMVSAMFFAFQAHADAYKCKDEKGKISYQGTPCATDTVGRVNKVSDAPLSDQIRARKDVNDAIEKEQRIIAAEAEAKEKRKAEQKARVGEYRLDDLEHKQRQIAEKQRQMESDAFLRSLQRRFD